MNLTARRISRLQGRFNIKVNKAWTFPDNRSIETHTHNYHRYPAKFIPQIVKKLIEKYTDEGDVLADVFAGCGTTLVESKVHGRISIGVDINPVAKLITEAKINPIRPKLLQEQTEKLLIAIAGYNPKRGYKAPAHERIDYWFFEEEKNKIAFLYNLILKIKNQKVRDFFLCALSNILKNCSKWLQDSTKPQINPVKDIPDPFESFNQQVKKMFERNEQFYNHLKKEKLLKVKCNIKLADARKTGIRTGSVSAIITSPPYVTSYEYADIHQLTGYWFEYITEMSSFRKRFIGTFYSSSHKELTVPGPTAKLIVEKLEKKYKKLSEEVANYFNDMYAVAKEMDRILEDDGVACLVVGNTTLRNVKIKSAEVFAEMLISLDFRIEKIIKRDISNKIIPATRHKITGKFTTIDSKNSKKVYPDEYIIIAKK